MDTVKYDAIRPSIENAIAIQRLKQESPQTTHPQYADSIADPDLLFPVARQYDELRNHRESFMGAYVAGKLIGFMRVGDWTNEDDFEYYGLLGSTHGLNPFGEAIEVLPSTLKLGIFDLATSSEISDETAVEVTDRLVDLATDFALGYEHAAVNIGVPEYSITQAVVRDQGFIFTGRIHESLARAGILQRLYSKPLDT